MDKIDRELAQKTLDKIDEMFRHKLEEALCSDGFTRVSEPTATSNLTTDDIFAACEKLDDIGRRYRERPGCKRDGHHWEATRAGNKICRVCDVIQAGQMRIELDNAEL